MRINESTIRRIIREEARRALREGETFVLGRGVPRPRVGDRIPASAVTRGMSDIEGTGAARARGVFADPARGRDGGSRVVPDDFAGFDPVDIADAFLNADGDPEVALEILRGERD